MLRTLTTASPSGTLAPSPRPQPARHIQALADYGRVSLEAKVATASPHELVNILYQHLVQHLREAAAGARTGNSIRRLRATERAITIIEGLDATLDQERGGTVAQSLHQVYELLRFRLLSGEAASLEQALKSAQSIAEAWALMAKLR